MLALRMFFWDGHSWSEIQEMPLSNAGGAGLKRRKKPKDLPDWKPDDYFWQLRWRYIRRLQAEFDPTPLPDDQIPPTEEMAPEDVPETAYNFTPYPESTDLPRFINEREALLLLAKTAQSLDQLRNVGARIAQLNRTIAHVRTQVDPEITLPKPKKAPKKLTAHEKKQLKLYALSTALLTLLQKN